MEADHHDLGTAVAAVVVHREEDARHRSLVHFPTGYWVEAVGIAVVVAAAAGQVHRCEAAVGEILGDISLVESVVAVVVVVAPVGDIVPEATVYPDFAEGTLGWDSIREEVAAVADHREVVELRGHPVAVEDCRIGTESNLRSSLRL